MRGNTVDGKPVLFISESFNHSYSQDYGQIIIVKSSSINISGISISNVSSSIQVLFSDDVSINNSVLRFSPGFNIECLYSSNLIFDNCTFDACEYGIKFYECSDIEITRSFFFNNNIGVWGVVVHRNFNINHCDFSKNTWAVSFHLPDETVDAENNWWGDPSGPYHEVSNPSGKGDKISGDVDFIPYLLKENKNTPPKLFSNIFDVKEDEMIEFSFTSTDDEDDQIEWITTTNASFLTWNSDQSNYKGIPLNNDVGEYWIDILLVDERGARTHRNFTFNVINIPPEIIVNLVTDVDQGSHLQMDFNSTDDGQGIITWNMATNASWLEFDNVQGSLDGIPDNDDVGSFWCNISVNDGNGGTDWDNFTITVHNINDPPEMVLIIPDQTLLEDGEASLINLTEFFSDPDGDDLSYNHDFVSNLSIQFSEHSMRIWPLENWSGKETITLRVNDSDTEIEISFNVTVEPVPDSPEIINIDYNGTMNHNETQYVSVEVQDPDEPYGDTINITWTSNISGVVGYGERVFISLIEGTHEISVQVEDSFGLASIRSIIIWVEGDTTPIDDPDNDTGDDDDTDDDVVDNDSDDDTGDNDDDDDDITPSEEEDDFPWWIIVIIAIAIILLVAIFLILLRRRKSEETIEEAPIEMDNASPQEDNVNDSMVVDSGVGLNIELYYQAQPPEMEEQPQQVEESSYPEPDIVGDTTNELEDPMTQYEPEQTETPIDQAVNDESTIEEGMELPPEIG
jgi:hypothetical protein